MLLVNYRTKDAHLVELILISILVMVFSWFIHNPWPARLLSFFALLAVAWIISDHILLLIDLGYQLKRDLLSSKMIILNLIGLQLGIAVALYFRYSSQMN